jgi:hypothetical protein
MRIFTNVINGISGLNIIPSLKEKNKYLKNK